MNRMRSASLLLWAVVTSFWIFGLSSLIACPGCNIHNYLAESVCCSSNIIIGKVITQRGAPVEIEVVRNVHGSIRAGQVVHRNAWSPDSGPGKLFLFCEENVLAFQNPYFAILPVEMEDEVVFLLKLRSLQKTLKPRSEVEARMEGHLSSEVLRKYTVKDAKEAIRLVQGFSNQSKEIGVEYLRKLRPFPTRQIIDTIETIQKEVLAGKEVFAADNRLANLVEALMLNGDQEAQDYLLQNVETFLKQEPTTIDWNKPGLDSNKNVEFLTAVLGVADTNWNPWAWAYVVPNRKQFPTLAARQNQAIVQASPILREQMLADITAAMYEAKLGTPEALLAKFNGLTNHNAFALGIARIAGPKAHPLWGSEADLAFSDLRFILPLITRPELKRVVEERIRLKDAMRER